jgi:hypothetical protein
MKDVLSLVDWYAIHMCNCWLLRIFHVCSLVFFSQSVFETRYSWRCSFLLKCRVWPLFNWIVWRLNLQSWNARLNICSPVDWSLSAASLMVVGSQQHNHGGGGVLVLEPNGTCSFYLATPSVVLWIMALMAWWCVWVRVRLVLMLMRTTCLNTPWTWGCTCIYSFKIVVFLGLQEHCSSPKIHVLLVFQ